MSWAGPAPGRPAVIDDPEDERLDGFRNLRDPSARRQVERDTEVFVVEGIGALGHLLGSRWPVRAVLFSLRQAESHPAEMEAALAKGAAVHVVGAAVIAELVGFAFHRGVLALAERQPELDARSLAGQRGGLVSETVPGEWHGRRKLLVIEGVNDHENLGALYRNAAAFGVEGVLLDPTCADPLYRRSIRVSVGHVLRVPWARLAPWPSELGMLASFGWLTVALTPDRHAPPLDTSMIEAAAIDATGWADQPSSTGTPRSICQPGVIGVALMVGSEWQGLSKAAMAAADVVARLPMADGVDSINVATAAAVALYTIDSERRATSRPPTSPPSRVGS